MRIGAQPCVFLGVTPSPGTDWMLRSLWVVLAHAILWLAAFLTPFQRRQLRHGGVMRLHTQILIPVVLAWLLLIAACQARVVYLGTEVEHPTLKTAARTVYAIELTAASIAKFFYTSLGTDLVPNEVVTRYANEIGPRVQIAIEAARDAIIRAHLRHAADEDIELVQVVLLELAEAVQVAQELAGEYGW